jgi:hypothetical protein
MPEPSRFAYSATIVLISLSMLRATRSYVPCRFSRSGTGESFTCLNSTAGKPGYSSSLTILWTRAVASNSGSTSSSTTFTASGTAVSRSSR